MVGRRAVGIIFLLLVVVLWVGSSELIQLIFDNPRFRFESPLFLTFYSTSLFSVYLWGFIFNVRWQRSLYEEPLPRESARPFHDEEEHSLLDELSRDAGFEGRGVAETAEAALASPYTTMKLAAQFAPLWIAANFCFNTSLCRSCGTGTAVSSNTLLSSSSGAFTLVLSVLFLGEPLACSKCACVLLSSAGVCLLVMYDGTPEEGHNIYGDLMALAAAACMGAYSVQLKLMLGAPTSPTISMPMFFGFLGVTAVLLGIPIFVAVVLLQVTGWAHLELLSNLTPDVFGALTVNGLVGTVLSDVLWAEAVLRTSPLAVNLSTCLTIPLAFLVDYLRGVVPHPPQALYVVGACCVFIAFIGVNVIEYLSTCNANAHNASAHEPGAPWSQDFDPSRARIGVYAEGVRLVARGLGEACTE